MARCGDTAELGKMVMAGLPPNLYDSRGNSLLMLAAYNDQAETFTMLIEPGAEVDRRNDYGQTPLGGVAFKGKIAMFILLLGAGAVH